MISYTLKCADGHTFESWFQSADAYDKLHAQGHVLCVVCGTSSVEKALMAPAVARGGDGVPERPLSRPLSPAEQALAEFRRRFEAVAEDVGDRFVEEARAMHAGTAPERAIYGTARIREARELIEEGIPVAPLPWGNRRGN